ncbi:MAG: acetoacetate--CoA ligase [Planctomycetota bacterium]|jgi:acetoacetyl-CoA synthetase
MTRMLWQPTPDGAARSRLAAFARHVDLPADHQELYEWSVAEPAAFWRQLWEFSGVVGSPGEKVLADADRMPGARWFPEARLNFAENLLQCDADNRPAILFRREDGHRQSLSFGDLRRQVLRARVALQGAGVVAGDRVAALLPNLPEAVVAMLAATSLGAVWSTCSPDFGTASVLDRFAQIEPKLLLLADGHLYKGRRHDQLGRLDALRQGLPTVTHVVLVPCTNTPLPADTQTPDTETWAAFLGRDDERLDSERLDFERFHFDHPLYVLFSSGTTGKPKCIVHGAGGTLLQHLKEHQLHTDLGPQDRLFYFTTTGWMMWNWLVSALASGATIVLYDGNPVWPAPDALWDLAQEEGATVFGTSAKYIDACKKADLTPGRSYDLTALRAILSTGSPLAPESFDWVYDHVKEDVQLASISGGTDIVSCFALGSPLLPVWRGELQCRGLGMQVEVFDGDGNAVVGKPGELVCTAPFPSMPVGFHGDPDGGRYRAAYFEKFPGAWHHGDWATLTERGSLVITGRSDATLNPGGVRIGTAEIYRQVEQLEEISESVVVGQDWQGDQRVVLFVMLQPGRELDDALRERIRRRIRKGTTPRHVPAVIAQVTDIPRTRSGKISELAVQRVVAGREVQNTDALANPEVLAEYRDRPELAPV